MKKLFFLLFSTLVSTAIIAQHQNVELAGVVIDSVTYSPVEYATVTLHATGDSSLVNGSLTNQQGEFRLSHVSPGEYYLQVDRMGYIRSWGFLFVSDSIQTHFDTLFLSPSASYLEAVAVTGEVSRQNITTDKTIIRVDQSAAGTTGSLYDLLREQPNIIIDADNTVYLRGNSNVRLMIDGQPVEIDMLDALPASLAEQVEIITNPDVTYEAEGSGGIINIVTRETRSRGFSGNARVNYGFPGRVNGGFGVGLTKERFGVHLNYSVRHEETPSSSQLFRHLFNEGSKIDQEISSVQRDEMQSAQLGWWFRPVKGHMVRLSIRSAFPKIHTNQLITSKRCDAPVLMLI